MSNRSKIQLLHIATIGKVVGLKGDMKLHIFSDFPQQFRKGESFYIDEKAKESVTMSDVNLKRGLFKIEGYTTPESARKFTNKKLYTTIEKTRENCPLEEGEHFWFDIEGCEVVEDSRVLGIVDELDRIASITYLKIKTDKELLKSGLAKSFLLPYHKPFLIKTDIEKKVILVSGAYDILEAS